MVVFLKVLSSPHTSGLGTFSKTSVVFPLKTFYFSERGKIYRSGQLRDKIKLFQDIILGENNNTLFHLCV